MLSRVIGRLLASVLLAALCVSTPAFAQRQGQRAEVVVELFTSQGCTQCPRANRLLGILADEENTIGLTFPVDIWDYLGWADTLANADFTRRHRAYASSLRGRRFTPQLVVNGARQLSASDWDEARAVFESERSPDRARPQIEMSLTRLRNDRIRVTFGAAALSAPLDVWMVSYDPGPVIVLVTGGPNTNRSVPHNNVAIDIEQLGPWSGEAIWYERRRCRPYCAILVQEPNGGQIVAAAYVSGAPVARDTFRPRIVRQRY
jgi:hypothetical protein